MFLFLYLHLPSTYSHTPIINAYGAYPLFFARNKLYSSALVLHQESAKESSGIFFFRSGKEVILMNTRKLSTMATSILCLSFMIAPASMAFDYGLSGLVGSYAEGGGAYSEVMTNYTEVTSLTGQSNSAGPMLNAAGAMYYGDLAKGSLGASAWSISVAENITGPSGSYVDYREAQASSYVAMKDKLHFTIPAGTYQNPLILVMGGAFEGSITSNIGGQARASYSAKLTGLNVGEEWFSTGDIKDLFGQSYYDPFLVSTILLFPGTYSTQKEVDVYLEFTIGGPVTLLAASTLQYASNVDVDFSNTLQITLMSVPDGLSWTSASGVFLSQLLVRA